MEFLSRVRRSPCLAAAGLLACCTPFCTLTVSAAEPDGAADNAANSAAQDIGKVVPASVAEARRVIDLRKFEHPKNSDVIHSHVTQWLAKVPLKMSEAKQHYLAGLTAAGWQEVVPPPGLKHRSGRDLVTLTKSGFRLVLNLMSDGGEADRCRVSITCLGNVDARSLPVPRFCKVIHSDEDSIMADASISLKELVDGCQQTLSEAGWQPFIDTNSTARRSDDDEAHLNFRKRGVKLSAWIKSDGVQEGGSTLLLSLEMLPNELPWPSDAEEVRFGADFLSLRCVIKQSRERTFDFYVSELLALNWEWDNTVLELRSGGMAFLLNSVTEKSQLQVKLHGHKDNDGNDRTYVEIMHIPAALRDFVNPQPSDLQAAARKRRLAKDDPDAIHVSSLPIPKGAKDIKYDAGSHQVTFKSKLSIAKLTSHFRSKLDGKVWTEEKQVKPKIKQPRQPKTFENLQYSHAGKHIFVMLSNSGAKGEATSVTILAAGLAWGDQLQPVAEAQDEVDNKHADTPPKEPSKGLMADDVGGLPIPSNRTEFSGNFSKFRKSYSAAVLSPISPVAAFYRAELTRADWKEVEDASKSDKQTALLRFKRNSEELTIKLTTAGDDTLIELICRDPVVAGITGILPKPGKALLLIANATAGNVTIKVNKQVLQAAAGVGTKAIDGPQLNLAPGKYTLEISDGQATIKHVVDLKADETTVFAIEDITGNRVKTKVVY